MDFTPTRWHEPTRLPPWGARLRRIGPVIPPTDPRVAALREALLETDPLADDVAAWLRERSVQGARSTFERAVEQGPRANGAYSDSGSSRSGPSFTRSTPSPCGPIQ